jgi:hypothetical protein
MVSQFKFVDVDGTRRPNTAGVDDFVGKDGAFPEGPHSVALRHEPNEANPHAVAVYLDDRRHVGWIGTTWDADSPELIWVQELSRRGPTAALQSRMRVQARAGGHVQMPVLLHAA